MLDRAVWTEADFDRMGWHDATVYAVAFPVDPSRELLLDIDYIVRWVDAEPPARHFTFWVSPATLVFHDVRGLRGEIEGHSDLEIADITRGDDARADDDRWTIEGHNFQLTFVAAGFHQHFRSLPMDAGKSQSLGDRRGAISFARPTSFPE